MKTLLLATILFSLCFAVQAQEIGMPLALDLSIPLAQVEGRIDHLAVDLARQRLFVAALGNNSVEVVDLKAGKILKSLTGFAEPQGVLYVPEFNRIFVANGNDGICRVLDGDDFRTIAKVEVGDDADNVRYDEKTKEVYVGYGNGALAILDAKSARKTGEIKLAGHPESFRLEENGARIFVNVPRAEHIAVVDRKKRGVIGTWPLKNAQANFPMALDEQNHRLFIGCRKPAEVLVYDSEDQHARLVTSVTIGGDTDDLFYDRQNAMLYVSCGAGVIDCIKQIAPDRYDKIASIPTPAGSRTSLFVPELNRFCLAVPHRGNQLAQIRVYKTGGSGK